MSKYERYYKKVRRYEEKKRAFENLRVNFKLLLGRDEESKEEMTQRIDKQIARGWLVYLIGVLISEQNSYETRQKIEEYEIVKQWLDFYRTNIYSVTKEDIDILFKIIKKI